MSEEATVKQQRLRKANRIKVRGNDTPAMLTRFADLEELEQRTLWTARKGKWHCSAELLDNLHHKLFFAEPTPIQKIAIPALLDERDIFGVAPTGSGKTAAFVVPTLMLLQEHVESRVRALILAPTRELAKQIYEVAIKAAPADFVVRYASDSTVRKYIKPVEEQPIVDLLISTPMLVVHMITNGKHQVDLSNVEVLIFDEADHLFGLGFQHQIDEIIAACSMEKLRSISLFTATLIQPIEDLARSALRDPLHIQVGVQQTTVSTVDQELVFVGEEDGKLMAIRQLVATGQLAPPGLIFVQSKERAKELFQELAYDKMLVDMITSDMPQHVRDQKVLSFRSRETWYLIATDIMARGIDFLGVQTVVNFDFPQSVEQYIHRIGRTGRAGRCGRSITLYTKQDVPFLKNIATVIHQSGGEVPDWMLDLKKLDRTKKRRLTVAPPQRESVSTISKYDRNRLKNFKHHREQQQLAAKAKNSDKQDKQTKSTDKQGESTGKSTAKTTPPTKKKAATAKRPATQKKPRQGQTSNRK